MSKQQVSSDNRQPATGAWRATASMPGGLTPVSLSALLGGGVLAIMGLRRRSGGGAILALLGSGTAAAGLMAGRDQGDGALVARHLLTIARSPRDVYTCWRDFEHLPRVLHGIKSIHVLADDRSHWTAKGPFGRSVEWDAEMTDDQPGSSIAWRSLDGVRQQGLICFRDASGGRGTEVEVTITYAPPGGALGSLAMRLSGREPRAQLRNDMRRFKALLESGELPGTTGQPAGERSAIGRLAQTIAARR
jgi:uncharacterized membrane protein